MSIFLSETEIARFLGQNLPVTRKALKSSKLKSIQKRGQKVFHRDDVLNWLAEKFTSLTSERLIKADHSSADYGGLDPLSCGVTNLLKSGEISFAEKVSTRSKMLRYIADKAVKCGAVYDATALREQLNNREEVISTALKCGAALVHPFDIKQLYIEKELLLLVIPPHPIPFGESSGRLTSLFFLLLFPDPHRHVHVLARLNRLLRNDTFINNILDSSTTTEVLNILLEHELNIISSRR